MFQGVAQLFSACITIPTFLHLGLDDWSQYAQVAALLFTIRGEQGGLAVRHASHANRALATVAEVDLRCDCWPDGLGNMREPQQAQYYCFQQGRVPKRSCCKRRCKRAWVQSHNRSFANCLSFWTMFPIQQCVPARRREDKAFWRERYNVRSAPAAVFLRGPGTSPLAVHAGMLSGTLDWADVLAQHGSQTVPPLNSATAVGLGCTPGWGSTGTAQARLCLILVSKLARSRTASRQAFLRPRVHD